MKKNKPNNDKKSYKERQEERQRKTTRYTIIGFVVALGLVLGLLFTFVLPKVEKIHNHVFINIVVNGEEMTIPKDVGIETNPEYFKYHDLDKYSSKAGHSPLHTHNEGGPIHVESTEYRDYTLGEFLLVAGWDFDYATKVTLTADGQVVADKSNYKDYVLKDLEHLVLTIEE